MKLAELVGIARPLEVTRHGLVQRLAVPPGVPGPEALATIKIVCDAPKNSEAVGSSNANSHRTSPVYGIARDLAKDRSLRRSAGLRNCFGVIAFP